MPLYNQYIFYFFFYYAGLDNEFVSMKVWIRNLGTGDAFFRAGELLFEVVPRRSVVLFAGGRVFATCIRPYLTGETVVQVDCSEKKKKAATFAAVAATGTNGCSTITSDSSLANNDSAASDEKKMKKKPSGAVEEKQEEEKEDSSLPSASQETVV